MKAIKGLYVNFFLFRITRTSRFCSNGWNQGTSDYLNLLIDNNTSISKPLFLMHILSPKLRVINHLPKIIKSHIVNQIPIHLIFLITPPRQHLHIHCLCSIICTPQRLCISRIEFCSLRCSSLGFRQKRQRFWRRYYFIGFFVRRQPRGFSFGCYLHLRNWSWLLEGKCWGKTGSLLTWPVILTMPEMLDWFSVGQQLQKFRVTLCSLVNFIHIISKALNNKLPQPTH